MALSPAIRAAIKQLDAAHADFFAALDREARKTPPSEEGACRLCGKPIRKGQDRYREPGGDVHPECRDQVRRQGR